MVDVNPKLELNVNDLLLMNVVEMSDQGPVFGVIDKVGFMEPEQVSIDSPSGNSQDDHAVTNAADRSEDSRNKDLQKEKQQVVIEELERRRAALDTTIAEMKRDVAGADTSQFKAVVGAPITDTGESSSPIVKPRKLRREGTVTSDRH